MLLIVPCYQKLPFCLNTRSCQCLAGIIMGSHVSIEYTLSMIQAFIGKGHSTDRIRLIIAKNDLFSSCRNTYISVKYSYSSPQQSVSAGTFKSSCASSQPEKQRSMSVKFPTKNILFQISPELKPRAASVPLPCGCCFSTKRKGIFLNLQFKSFHNFLEPESIIGVVVASRLVQKCGA